MTNNGPDGGANMAGNLQGADKDDKKKESLRTTGSSNSEVILSYFNYSSTKF